MFWGYALYYGVASTTSLMLESSRMAVVFDLDETLLVANSASTLINRVEAARNQRCAGPAAAAMRAAAAADVHLACRMLPPP